MMNSIALYFQEVGPTLLQAISEHLSMTFIAVVVAVIIGIPLGILCTYNKKLSTVILNTINMTQSIPSLAILGLLIPFFGIGSTPAVIMVTIFALLPIVKNTYAGISNISPSIIETANGLGYTKMQRLFHIELPMAMTIIMSGVRISAVTAVGTMTIAAYVGGGGLGTFIYQGISSTNYTKVLTGAIPAALLSLVVDYAIKKMEDRMANRTKEKITRKKVFMIASAVVLLFSSFMFYTIQTNRADITIGSKQYPEQVLLGNIYAEFIEHETDIKVRREFTLGTTDIAFQAIKSNEVDGYIEYTGSSYLTYLKNTYIEGETADDIYKKVKSQMADHGVRVFTPIGFNNAWSLGLTQETAEKYPDINTLSDLKRYSHDFRFISTIDFNQRGDGYVGMENLYRFNFKTVTTAEGLLRYEAANIGQTDVLEIYTTDGLIEKYNIKVLEDDLKFFPPYHAVPLMREEVLEEYPELIPVIEKLGNTITQQEMQRMNLEVVDKQREPRTVVLEFLEKRNWFRDEA